MVTGWRNDWVDEWMDGLMDRWMATGTPVVVYCNMSENQSCYKEAERPGL
jgi:hypothetical protein